MWITDVYSIFYEQQRINKEDDWFCPLSVSRCSFKTWTVLLYIVVRSYYSIIGELFRCNQKWFLELFFFTFLFLWTMKQLLLLWVDSVSHWWSTGWCLVFGLISPWVRVGWTVSDIQVLPLCPERPPGAEVCLTSGTVWWFLLLAEDQVSLEHTALSWSPDAPSSYDTVLTLILPFNHSDTPTLTNGSCTGAYQFYDHGDI